MGNIFYRAKLKDSNQSYVLKDSDGYYIHSVEAAIAAANREYGSKWERVYNHRMKALRRSDGSIGYVEIF